MTLRWLGLLPLIVTGIGGALAAAPPGASVVVVYNSKMPDSRKVAEHYAEVRKVPSRQVFGLDLPTGEDMSRLEFEERLQKPLLEKIAKADLWRFGSRNVPATTNQPARQEFAVVESKIRYAVLCYGVPLRIQPDPNHVDPGQEAVRPELRRNEAAVDNELAMLPSVRQKFPLFGPIRNWAYTTTNTAMLHPTNGLLMVARLDGPTPDLAQALVDKAVEAEDNGLWGRAYYDMRGINDPGYRIGDEWIRTASEVTRCLGWDQVVDTNAATFPVGFPLSNVGIYAGWYDADVSGPFTAPKVEFMPGAFAYHIHSYSAGTLRSTNRGWAGPLVAKGVTATMGCVFEPFLSGTPDVGTFMARWMFGAMTFAEAAYSCQGVLSWQTTVVGDPLYRPFARNPDQYFDILQLRKSPLVDWYWVRLLNMNIVLGKPSSDCSKYLEEMGSARSSAILSEKLGDFYAAQGKPSSAVHAWQTALNAQSSPMQRLRLRLGLGEQLTALERPEDAFEDYKELLAENPAYPAKLQILHKLLALAQQLKKPEAVTNYEEQIKRLSAPPKS